MGWLSESFRDNKRKPHDSKVSTLRISHVSNDDRRENWAFLPSIFLLLCPGTTLHSTQSTSIFFQGCFSLSVHYWAGVVELSRTTDNFKLSTRRELTGRDAKQRWRRATPPGINASNGGRPGNSPSDLSASSFYRYLSHELEIFFCCTTTLSR